MAIKNMIQGILVLAIIVFISCGRSDNANKSSETKASPSPEMKSDARIKNAMAFINGYVENANKMKKSADISEWVNSNHLSTKSFKKELKRIIDEAYKREPEIGLEADPVFDAQDYPDKGFELESFDEKSGYMIVRGVNRPEFRLTMKIVNDNGNWLVDGCGIINIPEAKKIKR